MPGYARPTNIISSLYVTTTPTGDISATNLQDALTEISVEKAGASVVSSLSAALDTKADLIAGGTAVQNNQTIATDYTFPANKNAVSAGPITINTGITVTIPTGSEWSIV